MTKTLTLFSYLPATVIAILTPVVLETYEVTAYSCMGIESAYMRELNCPNGITTSGTVPDHETVACDPSMLGSEVYIPELEEVRTCEDTGGDIGDNRLDLYLPTIEAALDFGVQKMFIKII